MTAITKWHSHYHIASKKVADRGLLPELATELPDAAVKLPELAMFFLGIISFGGWGKVL